MMPGRQGIDSRRSRAARLALVAGASALVLCANGQADAGPVSVCSGVAVNAFDGTAIVDTSRFAAGCVAITGAELSMNGAIAPMVNFGTPSGVTTTYTYDTAGRIDIQIDMDSGSGPTTYHMVYDSIGRLATETTTDSADPSGLTTTYTYASQWRLSG